jgi:hypothetical protein
MGFPDYVMGTATTTATTSSTSSMYVVAVLVVLVVYSNALFCTDTVSYYTSFTSTLYSSYSSGKLSHCGTPRPPGHWALGTSTSIGPHWPVSPHSLSSWTRIPDDQISSRACPSAKPEDPCPLQVSPLAQLHYFWTFAPIEANHSGTFSSSGPGSIPRINMGQGSCG